MLTCEKRANEKKNRKLNEENTQIIYAYTGLRAHKIMHYKSG